MNTYTNAFPKGHKWDYTKYKEEKGVIELLNAKEECDKYWDNIILISNYIPSKSDYEELKELSNKAIDSYINSYKNLFYWECIDELSGSRGVFGRVSRVNFKYDLDITGGLENSKVMFKGLLKKLLSLLLSPSNTSLKVTQLRRTFDECLNNKLFCNLVLSYPK